jgi:SAM-dependent methyltransferase
VVPRHARTRDVASVWAVYLPPLPPHLCGPLELIPDSRRSRFATIGLVPNPWLRVPLEEYEGHMESPAVAQLCVLADLFAEALARCRPHSVAVLGVAGGNGLERIDPAVTERVVGFDFNPSYLETVRRRHASLRGLELNCVDLAKGPLKAEPVELVHAALIFEHAGTGRCLDNAVQLVAPGGTLSVVLQLPGDPGTEVAATRFPSVQQLRPGFSLIDPAEFGRAVEARGLRLSHEARRPLPAGKGFWMGLFTRA